MTRRPKKPSADYTDPDYFKWTVLPPPQIRVWPPTPVEIAEDWLDPAWWAQERARPSHP